jgi:hypothetical protein
MKSCEYKEKTLGSSVSHGESEIYRNNKIIEYANKSFEQELDREKSIIAQACQMMTAFSFITVVVLLFVPILIDILIPQAKIFVIFSSVIITFLLLCSFILALVSTWRFKIHRLQSPKDFQKYVNANSSGYDEYGFQIQWIDSLDKMQKSREKTNGTRVNLVLASMIVFFFSLFTVFLFILIGCFMFA